MKKIIVTTFILGSLLSCKNQTKEMLIKTNNTPKIQQQIPIRSIDFFIGTWELQKKTIGQKVYETKCKEKSTWLFTKKGDQILQQKRTVHKDCKTRSSNEFGRVKLKQPNGLLYFVDDVGLYVDVSIIDKNNILIRENEIINGQKVNIISNYKRVK